MAKAQGQEVSTDDTEDMIKQARQMRAEVEQMSKESAATADNQKS
jgi:hypothetical protein